ncbi:hypothetical protein MUO74_07345 [Candidatus Bathyarchaeota archaeon]|nr:hypothetical protein [Candidatus Bathyarchaeota archaeon]
MARKSEAEFYEIRLFVEEDDIQKLETGKSIELGCITFGKPIVITLKKSLKTAPKIPANEQATS